MKPSSRPSFPSILQDYFCQRLLNQMKASPRTIGSYRDTFRLLLRYIEERLRKPPVTISLADLDAPLILGFLDHLEKERGNGIRTRNARLAAVRSFMQYAAVCEPPSLAVAQRVLAIPPKRFQRPLVAFLSRDEIQALLGAPDEVTWSGRRDRAMFATCYNVGARVSEIISIRIGDVSLNQSPHVSLHGKGRKDRTVPLWRDTAARLKQWLKCVDTKPDSPLFPNRKGEPLTRSGVESRLRVAVRTAANQCRSLSKRHVSPHVLRHTTAMHLLQSGVDLSVIALWLGHESPSTTHIYVEADLSMKEKALSMVQEPPLRHPRFRADDKILRFLDSL